jgi:NAD(P)-dependent dehydrogenase (short-subunit alcohol dehydrogenase family)
MAKLDGKVCIVTGAAGGIGAAAAKLFVQEGARVLLVDRDSSRLSAIASEFGAKASYCSADVSRVEDTQSYVAAAVDRFGRLDVLFANAGTEGQVSPIAELTPEAFDNVFAVNVRGVFLAMKYAIPQLAKQCGGSIVITSSIAGLIGSPGLSAYVTSKHAVIGLMRSAAIELAPQGIRVNTINPGPIDNRMMRGIEGQLSPGQEQDVKRGFEGQVPLARYGTNEEIAKLALFLASDDASYCTGGVYVADGGFTAH